MAILSTTDGCLHGVNVRRLMAQRGMTLADVVAATGLDERTVRSLIREEARPHARTLHKLAAGLGVEVDELFRAPANYGGVQFDRAANPAVTRVIDAYPDVFAEWTPAEFDELYSRVAVGGELTEEGALVAANAMNRRRALMTRAAVVLESEQGELLRELIEVLYRRVTDCGERERSAQVGADFTARPSTATKVAPHCSECSVPTPIQNLRSAQSF